MSSPVECRVCAAPGMLCTRCRVDAYCGKQHQKRDWPRHKAGCGVFELEAGEGGARRLRATKDIPKGTVIIREEPCCKFPVSYSNAMICVVCCFELRGSSSRTLQCGKCGLPMCSKECNKNPLHQDECGVFQRAQFKLKKRDLDRYRVEWLWSVAALRLAMTAKRDPRLASLPIDFTSGRPELRVDADAQSPVMPKGLALYLMDLDEEPYPLVDRKRRVRVAQWLREKVGVSWLSEAELLRAATLSDLHSDDNISARPGEREIHEGRLYLGYSQLEHSCAPNTCGFPFKGSNNPLQEQVVVASRDIAAGEYLSKDFLVQGWMDETGARQPRILRQYQFLCRCPRCEDATEMGGYVGSPVCRECAKKGSRQFVIPSAQDAAVWRCEGCDTKTPSTEVAAWTKAAKAELKKLEEGDADHKTWMVFLESFGHPVGPLHPTHSIVLKAKDHLRRCIFQSKADDQASSSDLRAWKDVCRDLLAAMDKVCPGMHEHRLHILLELRRLLIRDLNDAYQKVALASGRCGIFARTFSLDSFYEPAGPTMAEAKEEEREAAQAIYDLDVEFGLYFFGIDGPEKEALMYPGGKL